MEVFNAAARVPPPRVVAAWPPDGGAAAGLGLDQLGMQQLAMQGGPSAPPPQLVLGSVSFQEWDPPAEDIDHLNGTVQGGDARELQCLQAPYQPDDEEEDGPEMEEFSRLLLALSGQRSGPAASHCSAAAEAEGSGCSVAAAAHGAKAAARSADGTAAVGAEPVYVPTPPGLSMPPAAAAACMRQAARASALPPAVIHAINGRPVQPVPGTACNWAGSSLNHGLGGLGGAFGSGSSAGASYGSTYCSGGSIGRSSSFAQAVGVHRAPQVARSSVQPMGGLSGLLQLPQDLEVEERHMAHISDAGEARLRMEGFGRPIDPLAQPCSSSHGGAAAAPALQRSDADTGPSLSGLALPAAALGEVQQHVGRHGSPGAQPHPRVCSAAGSEGVHSLPPCTVHVVQMAVDPSSSDGENVDEGPASGAQQDKGSQPSGKRKLEPSEWTLELLEAEGCLDMEQRDAARLLGYQSSTMLKKQMPRLGMQRWPYRMRSTCRGMLESAEKYIEAKAVHCGPEGQAKAAAVMAYVRYLLARVLANPKGACYPTCTAAKQKNQACYCNQLSPAEFRFRQQLYKLRSEADGLNASGRWGQRLQAVLDTHCAELAAEGAFTKLAAADPGASSLHPSAGQTPKAAQQQAHHSTPKQAGHSKRRQPLRTSQQPH